MVRISRKDLLEAKLPIANVWCGGVWIIVIIFRKNNWKKL